MPRAKTYVRESVLDRTMLQFWQHGYFATSISDLVAATGVNRHGLYEEFGGKKGVFADSMRRYFQEVVSPAFAPVETAGAGMNAIRGYFEFQIARAETMGLPGPGCLVANTMVEAGPHDESFSALVTEHTDRLTGGFANAFTGECRQRGWPVPHDVEARAALLTIFTQGFWSASRTVADAVRLREQAEAMIAMFEKELSP